MCDNIKKTDDYNKEERRKYLRVKQNLLKSAIPALKRGAFKFQSPVKNFIDVYFKVDSAKESVKEEKTDSKNTSLEGVCLIINKPIEVDTILDLRFKLFKDVPEVRIKGKVVWNKKFDRASYDTINYEIGIQFIEISESDKKNIAKIYLVT